MARSPLSALADVLTLAGEGLDALVLLSQNVIGQPSGRPADAVDEPGLVLVSRPRTRAMTRPPPSGGSDPSLGVARGGAQGGSVRAGGVLGGGTS